MDVTMNELSSSSYVSNGSSNGFASASSEPVPSLDSLSLTKLSNNLERLLVEDEFSGYTDAEIVIDDVPVGVHRCILASRSRFFHELFSKPGGEGAGEGKRRYKMAELVPCGKVGAEAFGVFLNYLYTGTGKLKTSPVEISTCVDESCAHDACPPAINYAVELMYASATFEMKELVLLVQRRLLNFVEKALVEDLIPILVVAFYCQLSQLLAHCVQRVAKSDLDAVVLEKELPVEVSSEIEALRRKTTQQEAGELIPSEIPPPSSKEKQIRKIHRALDCDDVELMKMLLKESEVTLDDAHALHYAVAYCDPKVVKEVLALELADIGRRDPRGHTVLHVAARRRETSVLVALLERGASATEATLDGRSAVAICRRLTRPKDYHQGAVQGRETNRDRICIDVLEREMRRNSIAGNMSSLTEPVAEDLHARLDYFENRVAFARLLFPTEARLAIEMADDHITAVYARLSGSKGSTGNLREVDLNETPARRTKRLQLKLQSLIKTVEKGRHYFPHCSEVLDRFLDEIKMPDVQVLEKGTPEEQQKKKTRFMELKDEVHKAFSKDMAENNRSVLATSSTSSSSSPKAGGSGRSRRKS